MPRKRQPRLILTRESVCAADDIDAPHRREWILSKFPDFSELLRSIKSAYLPRNIQGGRATWVGLLKDLPIALIAQQWDSPRSLAPASIIEGLHREDKDVEIHWTYLGNEDPEKVIDDLQMKNLTRTRWWRGTSLTRRPSPPTLCLKDIMITNLEWNSIVNDLALGIQDAIESFRISNPNFNYAGLGIHVDAYYGDMGLYILSDDAEKELNSNDITNIGDWPISTDWDPNLEFAKAFNARWQKWAEIISSQLDDFTDEEGDYVFRKLLETACQALSIVETKGILEDLRKTSSFRIIISEHSEPDELGVERYNYFKSKGTVKVFNVDVFLHNKAKEGIGD